MNYNIISGYVSEKKKRKKSDPDEIPAVPYSLQHCSQYPRGGNNLFIPEWLNE